MYLGHSVENIVAEVTFQFWAIFGQFLDNLGQFWVILGNLWQFLAIFGQFTIIVQGYLSNHIFHTVSRIYSPPLFTHMPIFSVVIWEPTQRDRQISYSTKHLEKQTRLESRFFCVLR